MSRFTISLAPIWSCIIPSVVGVSISCFFRETSWVELIAFSIFAATGPMMGYMTGSITSYHIGYEHGTEAMLDAIKFVKERDSNANT
jgi:hypothetical protein